jgi:hypothetical protein
VLPPAIRFALLHGRTVSNTRTEMRNGDFLFGQRLSGRVAFTMDYHPMNATKHFLTHYANMLTLDWIAKHSDQLA